MAVKYQAQQSFGTVVNRRRYRFVQNEMYDLAPDVLEAFGKDKAFFVKVTVDTDDAPVEAATAAPGEKRATKKRVTKKTTT